MVHPLHFAPGPLDNPLKGFMPYFFKTTDTNTNGDFPHSMEWSYFGLSEVMTDASNCSNYNWGILDQMLDETGSRGEQATIRFYMEYPGGTGTHPANAVPPCFNGNVTMRTNGYWGTTSPDYDSPYLQNAVKNFITAYGARYDGDMRIASIHMGLVGLWGEWHTWPYDRYHTSQYPNLFPTDASVSAIINDYTAAFHKTPVEIRYASPGYSGATGPNGEAPSTFTLSANVGYHDDSWCYKEFRNSSLPYSLTLPVSIDGWPDAFTQGMLYIGSENKWTTNYISGEVRPEIQQQLFTGGGQVDDWRTCIELTHATSMIDQNGVQGGYSATDPTTQTGVRLMGYDFTVNNAYFNNINPGDPLKVGVQIQNDGVAPFYYGPDTWPVIIGVKDSSGNVVNTWQTTWDLRKVAPLQVRAFPDWNVGANPTYLPYGQPYYFGTSVSNPGLGGGTYTLVMRVKNPLENLSEAAVRASGHILSYQIWYPARKLRFANQEQGSDGWLSLGQITIGGPAFTLTPTNTPGPATATPTKTNTPVVAPTNTGTATSVPPSATPTPTPCNGNCYEAESSANTLAGGAAVATCSSCSGGAKVGYVGNNAGTLKFNGINASTAGSFSLTIYYCNGDTVSRTAAMSVNGGSATTLSFPVTGGWMTVGTLTTTITLNAGSSNTILFSNPTAGSWAPDFDRIVVGTSGSPTNTPVPATNTPQPTVQPPTNTPIVTPTQGAATNTPTKTNTPGSATNTPTKTNTPVPATSTPIPPTATSGGAALNIDSFVQAQWNNKLNDLGQSITWAMDSVYYGTANPNYIVTNSGGQGQYYEEDINRSLSAYTTLDLRIRDWNNGTGSEQHWAVDLNDGTDHSVGLWNYGTMSGSFQDFNIPLSAFGTNLANVKYLRIVHNDMTYAVILYNNISVR